MHFFNESVVAGDQILDHHGAHGGAVALPQLAPMHAVARGEVGDAADLHGFRRDDPVDVVDQIAGKQRALFKRFENGGRSSRPTNKRRATKEHYTGDQPQVGLARVSTGTVKDEMTISALWRDIQRVPFRSGTAA